MQNFIKPTAATGKCSVIVLDHAYNKVFLVNDIPADIDSDDLEDILSERFSISDCSWMQLDINTEFPVLRCEEDGTLTDAAPYRPTKESILKGYREGDVVMGEHLDSEPCGCLSVTQAHELYMDCMRTANGDRFFRCIGEDTDHLPTELPSVLEEL